MIIPNIMFSSPNPRIDFDKDRFQVPGTLLPWPRDGDLRVSITSFGIGGKDVYVIIEDPYTYICNKSDACTIYFGSPQLLLMSASTSLRLQTLSTGHREYIRKHPDSLPNIDYTLAHRREHH